jgi:hypothetical protein
VALLNFPPTPNNGDIYPSNPLPGQNQYEWSSAENTWRLLGPATGVIPGCYGDGSFVPTICLDAQGRATSVTINPLAAVTLLNTGVGLLGGPITTIGTIDLDVAYTDARYLQLAGGTMTGPITFAAGQIFPVSGIQDATTTQKGVVQIGTNIQVAGGVISVDTGTTANPGVVQLATDAETQAGTDSAKVVTPASLQSKVSDSTALISSTTIASSTAVKTAWDLADAAIPKSTLLAKGSLVGATAAGLPANVAVGLDGQILKADSTTPTGLAWGSLQFVSYDDVSAGFNGVTAAFSLAVGGVATPPLPSSNIMVYVGGVIQIPGSSYSVAGSTITFTGAPPAGASFYAVTVA